MGVEEEEVQDGAIVVPSSGHAKSVLFAVNRYIVRVFRRSNLSLLQQFGKPGCTIDGLVVLASSDALVVRYSDSEEFECWSWKTGLGVWNMKATAQVTQLLATLDGSVAVGTNSGSVLMVDGGEQVWNSECGIGSISALATGIDNSVVVASSGGEMTLLSRSGHKLWSHCLSGAIKIMRSSFDGGRIAVATDQNEITQVQLYSEAPSKASTCTVVLERPIWRIDLASNGDVIAGFVQPDRHELPARIDQSGVHLDAWTEPLDFDRSHDATVAARSGGSSQHSGRVRSYVQHKCAKGYVIETAANNASSRATPLVRSGEGALSAIGPNGCMVVSTFSYVCGFGADGSMLWYYGSQDPLTCIQILDDGRVLLNTHNGQFIELEQKTGAQLSCHSLGVDTIGQLVPLASGHVAVSTEGDAYNTTGGDVKLFSAQGEEKWSEHIWWAAGSHAWLTGGLVGGIQHLRSTKEQILALSRRDWNDAWDVCHDTKYQRSRTYGPCTLYSFTLAGTKSLEEKMEENVTQISFTTNGDMMAGTDVGEVFRIPKGRDDGKVASWSPLWSTIQIVDAKSVAGADCAVLGDNSIIVSGSSGKDSYCVTFKTSLQTIAAVRIEALTDESLPNAGPGRSAAGNFVVNDVTLKTPDEEAIVIGYETFGVGPNSLESEAAMPDELQLQLGERSYFGQTWTTVQRSDGLEDDGYIMEARGGGNSGLDGMYVPTGTRDGNPVFISENGARLEFWKPKTWWWADSSNNFICSVASTASSPPTESSSWVDYKYNLQDPAPSMERRRKDICATPYIQTQTCGDPFDFGEDFQLKMDLEVSETVDSWTNILRIAAPDCDSDCAEYGDRLVWIGLEPGSTNLHIVTATVENQNHCRSLKPLPLCESFVLKIHVNGPRCKIWVDEKLMANEEDLGARRAFRGVRLFVSDTHHRAAAVRLRNLTVWSKRTWEWLPGEARSATYLVDTISPDADNANTVQYCLTINQSFDEHHQLGKFRITVAPDAPKRAKKPLYLHKLDSPISAIFGEAPGDCAVVGTSNGQVVCYSQALEQMWSIQLGAEVTGFDLMGSHVLVGLANGSIAQLKMRDGTLYETIDVDGTVTDLLSVSGGTVVITNQSNLSFILLNGQVETMKNDAGPLKLMSMSLHGAKTAVVVDAESGLIWFFSNDVNRCHFDSRRLLGSEWKTDYPMNIDGNSLVFGTSPALMFALNLPLLRFYQVEAVVSLVGGKSSLERAMEKYGTQLAFARELLLLLTSTTQFISISFHPTINWSAPSWVSDMMTFPRKLGLANLQPNTSLYLAVLTVFASYAILTLQEHVEFRVFLGSTSWGSLWEMCNLYAIVVSTVLFMPVVDTLLNPLDCIAYNSANVFANDTVAAITPKFVLESDNSIVCYTLDHIIRMSICSCLLLAFTTLVLRLQRVDAILSSIEFNLRRPWRFQDDAVVRTWPLHPLGTIVDTGEQGYFDVETALRLVNVLVAKLLSTWPKLVAGTVIFTGGYLTFESLRKVASGDEAESDDEEEGSSQDSATPKTDRWSSPYRDRNINMTTAALNVLVFLAGCTALVISFEPESMLALALQQTFGFAAFITAVATIVIISPLGSRVKKLLDPADPRPIEGDESVTANPLVKAMNEGELQVDDGEDNRTNSVASAKVAATGSKADLDSFVACLKVVGKQNAAYAGFRQETLELLAVFQQQDAMTIEFAARGDEPGFYTMYNVWNGYTSSSNAGEPRKDNFISLPQQGAVMNDWLMANENAENALLVELIDATNTDEGYIRMKTRDGRFISCADDGKWLCVDPREDKAAIVRLEELPEDYYQEDCYQEDY